MNWSTSKTLRVEIVTKHMQVVVQAFPLPIYQCAASQTIHNEKFRFLALLLSHDVYASRKVMAVISTR